MTLEYGLEQLGLTRNEVKVYLALVDIGQTTTSAIIKNTGINTSKVYESLERLLRKGIVSYTIIKNKKHWQAEDPARIRDYITAEKQAIRKKEDFASAIIADLTIRKNIHHDTTTYKIYEGIKGVKTARENVLNVLHKGDTFYLILANYPQDERLESFWVEFQKKRAQQGIHVKYIINDTLTKAAHIRKPLPLTTVKYVNPDILSPTWTEIYGDYVSIGVLGENPSVFVIHNAAVAKGFLNYFNFLWTLGKKR